MVSTILGRGSFLRSNHYESIKGKIMKYHHIIFKGYIVVLFLFFSTNATSNDFKEWKNRHKSDVVNYKKGEIESYTEYKNVLNSEWDKFKLRLPQNQYSEPKLDTPPVAPKHETPYVTTPVLPKPEPAPKENIPQIPEKKPTKTPVIKKNQLSIIYLGKTFTLPKIDLSHISVQASEDSISESIDKTYAELSQIVEYINNNQDIKQLSDWGLISLLSKYTIEISNSSNSNKFLLWGILLQLHYDVRISYDNKDLYVLYSSKQKIYNRLSLTFEGKDYYILTKQKSTKSLYTYSLNQSSKKVFDFSFRPIDPVEGLEAKTKTLSSDKSSLSITYTIYPQLAEYYQEHPPLDFVWYFRSNPKDKHYTDMISSLKNKLKDYSTVQKVQALLTLIQYGFHYELDQDQWGEEYYATPMHTLMLNAVDCEDRSFLFSYLVEQVVGIPTVGLKYPGHLAVAVALPTQDVSSNSKYFVYNDQKYYVADPTYIGANIGEEMPNFKNTKASLILK